MVCRYTVKKVLGEGAYGKLYLVEDMRDGTQRALKTAMGDLCTNNRISAAETQIHLHVHHPYLMGGIDVFRRSDVDTCGLPMEAVTQGLLLPLADYDLDKIRKDDRDDPSYPDFNALRASWQLACALEALYAAGYVHMDIKPANILQKGDTTLLSDFGLAYWKTTKELDRLVITLTYRPPYVRDDKALPMSSYMSADLYSLGLVFLDITAGIVRPNHNDYEENVYVGELSKHAHARLDQLITRCGDNMNTPGFLEAQQKRWRLPLPSVDALVKYLKIIKLMVSPTPTALTATDVRLRLEALWPAHPPAPLLRIDPPPPLAEQYRSAAERVVTAKGFKNKRAPAHAVNLFLAVMKVVSSPPPMGYISYGLDGHMSWILPYLFACINIVATFYHETEKYSFYVEYKLANAILYDDTYAGEFNYQATAICAALQVIASSEKLRGQYNYVLPGEAQTYPPITLTPSMAASSAKRPQPAGFAAYQAFKAARYKDLRSQYSLDEVKARLAAEWSAFKTQKANAQ